jgi:ATP-dependent Clp protease adaptor protein ClpS
MTKTLVKPRTKVQLKTQRPPLYKVILLNDDYTPREFVVIVLKAVFRMNEDQAYRVMMTAHQKGACVIAVYVRDVAETKAKEATDLGKQRGYPLFFTTEPEEKADKQASGVALRIRVHARQLQQSFPIEIAIG